MAANDGQSFFDQSPETQAAFTAQFKGNAAIEWEKQHNAAIGATGAPPPTSTFTPSAPAPTMTNEQITAAGQALPSVFQPGKEAAGQAMAAGSPGQPGPEPSPQGAPLPTPTPTPTPTPAEEEPGPLEKPEPRPVTNPVTGETTLVELTDEQWAQVQADIAQMQDDARKALEFSQGIEQGQLDVKRATQKATDAYQMALIEGKNRELALTEARDAMEADFRQQQLELQRMIAAATIRSQEEDRDLQRRQLRSRRLAPVRFR